MHCVYYDTPLEKPATCVHSLAFMNQLRSNSRTISMSRTSWRLIWRKSWDRHVFEGEPARVELLFRYHTNNATKNLKTLEIDTSEMLLNAHVASWCQKESTFRSLHSGLSHQVLFLALRDVHKLFTS